MDKVSYGKNCVVSDDAVIGADSIIGHNCIIEGDVSVGNEVRIEPNCIIKRGTVIGDHSCIGANCILGEIGQWTEKNSEKLYIGDDALIRSGSILYTDSVIDSHFQTGHQVTIREKSQIGSHVCIGTLSDIQGHCKIGNYVHLHSNVHISQLSRIDDYVWIFPYVVLTNDSTPPSEDLMGVHISSFAIVAAGAVILPGITIGSDALVGAGAIVTKDVREYSVVTGNPAKIVSDVRNIRNKLTKEAVYPWRYHFERSMPWEGMGYEEWIRK